MTATDDYERAFREAGLGDDPDIALDLERDDIVVEAVGLGVRVTAGPRALLVVPGVIDMRASAYIDGEPAIVRGTVATRRLPDRIALARYLAEAEGSSKVRLRWLALVERALVELDESRPARWAAGLPPPASEASADFLLFPLIRSGLDSALLAHRSRGKSTLMMAFEYSLLGFTEVVPGMPVVAPVDAVVHVNYENPTALVHETMRGIVAGGDYDLACLERWVVVGQAETPSLDRLAEFLADVVEKAVPDARSLHVGLDSAEAAIATLGTGDSGDSWGMRASALFNAYSELRRLLPHVAVSTLTADHGDAKKPGLLDTPGPFNEMAEYGSRRKSDLARHVEKLGVFDSATLPGGVVVRSLAIAVQKPWPDRMTTGHIWIDAHYEANRNAIRFERGKPIHDRYPEGMESRSRGALIVDALRERAPDAATVEEVVAALVEQGERAAHLDQRVRETLRRRSDVFARAPGPGEQARWRLRGAWS